MKVQNIILAMFFAGLLLVIQSCGGGNDDNNPLPGNNPPSGQLSGIGVRLISEVLLQKRPKLPLIERW